MIFICISLMINDVKHFSTFHVLLCNLSFSEVSFKLFAHFFRGCSSVVSLPLSIPSFLPVALSDLDSVLQAHLASAFYQQAVQRWGMNSVFFKKIHSSNFFVSLSVTDFSLLYTYFSTRPLGLSLICIV